MAAVAAEGGTRAHLERGDSLVAIQPFGTGENGSLPGNQLAASEQDLTLGTRLSLRLQACNDIGVLRELDPWHYNCLVRALTAQGLERGGLHATY